MDPFTSFSEELIHGDSMLYWAFSPEPAFNLVTTVPEPVAPWEAPAVLRSAFTPYTGRRIIEAASFGNGGRRKSIHRRMIEMLRRIPKAKEECKGVEMSRGFKHKMRERQRREKLSQSYADLYSLLSSRSKGDKNSIVQSAAAYVRELKEVKEQKQRRNEELKAMISGSNGTKEEAKIKFRVVNPSSATDSMIEVLRCLKTMDVKARAIRSDLSAHDLSAIISIETKVCIEINFRTLSYSKTNQFYNFSRKFELPFILCDSIAISST
ncbi:transcription factor BHLH148-like [Phoenix dactylifera]|uniref:Transcription factor BHLH148-like n=1 Tax=Phoenix dactylifera TaxID=42345 RepID=A0A8B9AGN8_PHODC|nr:transcription factor BHLH148-like [Phoenix dactylifera]